MQKTMDFEQKSIVFHCVLEESDENRSLWCQKCDFLKCFKSLYNDVRGPETSLGTQTRVREAFLTHILTLRALLKNRKKM